MKNLIYLVTLILLTTSCNQSNGSVYKTTDECAKDGGCLGRNGTWYIKNDSYNKKIQFTYENTTTILSTGEKSAKTFNKILNPGETYLIGCVETSCGFGWEKNNIKIVGELEL